MAVQTTPHTQSQQNTNSAAADLEPNMNPQDMGRGEDAKIYENNDGAQTGGTRAFNANAVRDNQPKSIDEGTGMTPSLRNNQIADGDLQGVTNSPGSREHDRQEKVMSGK